MKKIISLVLSFVFILTLSTTAVYADTPFDDDSVIIDLPSGPDNEPIDPYNQLTGVYELTQQGEEPSDDSQNTSSGSSSDSNNSLETAATNAFGGDAANNAPGDFSRFENNTFDGKPTQFEGANGSVTSVYPDGSVVTENKDGSKQGVSGGGCPITIDKEGTETYQLEDGSIGKKYADGRKEQIYPDGSKLIQNADGSMSTYEPAGYYTDLDEDGNVKSVYFENGERIDLFDAEGNLIQGEQTITGPDGKKLSFVYKEDEEGNTTDFSLMAEIDGKKIGFSGTSEGEDDYSIGIYMPDGTTLTGSFTGDEAKDVDFVGGDGSYESHYKRDGNQVTFDYRDENGEGSISEIKTEDGITTTVKNSDGSSATMKTDNNGNVVSGEIKSKDGSTLKVNDDGTTEITDNETGLNIKLENGKITSAHIPLKDGSSYDFSDGTGVLVDKESGNKVMWTRDENGELVIVSPDGEYTVDENGNLFKDGKPVTFDGKQVNVDSGFNTGEPATEEEIASPLDINNIIGTYHLKGTDVITGGDGKYDKNEPTEVDIIVDASGDNAIKFTAKGDEHSTLGTVEYDPEHPTVKLGNRDDWEYTITFSEEGGKVHMNFVMFGFLDLDWGTGDDVEHYEETITLSGDLEED